MEKAIHHAGGLIASGSAAASNHREQSRFSPPPLFRRSCQGDEVGAMKRGNSVFLVTDAVASN